MDLPSPPPPGALLHALRRPLRPLLRLLIRAGVTFPVFAEMLRGLYVETAARDLSSDGGPPTDSRLALLTGVHRKEIRRLREEPAPVDDAPPAVVTLNSQLISRWLGLPENTNQAGDPLPLSRAAFDALVVSVTTDVRPRSVLDSWLAQGIATLDVDEHIRLNVAAFIPREGQEARLFYLARNLHDHMAAAAANVSAEGTPPFLERSLHYDGLSPEAAQKLEAAGRAAAQQLLVELNRLALSLVEGQATTPGAPTVRTNLGVYLYREEETP
ncbi:hypothetical protein EOD42_00740 [Rhodovarius crocodyli]|uniref:Uncharacterized protein n=1 Tax=Rhodovarius crocodyli TaxID=1979269 RepID=A0A437MPQ7_9PROT|nr:hypothetical protein EOD42_00740 [Rhodovarius crocodyli]